MGTFYFIIASVLFIQNPKKMRVRHKTLGCVR